MDSGIYPEYDKADPRALVALDRIEARGKNIIEQIQDNLTKPFEKVVQFIDQFNKNLGISDKAFNKLIAATGAVIIAFGALAGVVRIGKGVGKTAHSVGNLLTLGLLGKATGGLGKLLKSPVGKLGAAGAGGFVLWELIKALPGGEEWIKEKGGQLKELVTAGMDKADKALKAQFPEGYDKAKEKGKGINEYLNEKGEQIKGIQEEIINKPTDNMLLLNKLNPDPLNTTKQASVTQHNKITVEISGAEAPEMVAEHVVRKFNKMTGDELLAQLASTNARVG